MANRSMTFNPPLKNFHLSGDAPNRNKYSSVNHDIQTASTIASSGLSCCVLPLCVPLRLCSGCSAGIVFNVKAIVDKTMKRIDITAIIWNVKSLRKGHNEPLLLLIFVHSFWFSICLLNVSFSYSTH